MHSRAGEFYSVGENLYRYSSSGVYYVHFRSNGKQISHSLRRTHWKLAKRRLKEEPEKAAKIDPSQQDALGGSASAEASDSADLVEPNPVPLLFGMRSIAGTMTGLHSSRRQGCPS